jgi:hypothetical protein
MIGLTPDITEAAFVRHGVRRLTFSDGLSGEVDVLDTMRGRLISTCTRRHSARQRL